MLRPYITLICLVFVVLFAQAQDDKGITLSGSIQSDILIPENDKEIGTEEVRDNVLTNTYADLHLCRCWCKAGILGTSPFWL